MTNHTRPSIFVLTGEMSGDLLASAVVERIALLRPDIELFGVCGPALRRHMIHEICAMEIFQTLIYDAWLRLPLMYKASVKLCEFILARNPEICVFVDASTLSLKLAERLRKAGYRGKLVKYVCPSFQWKDGGRKKRLVRDFDALLCLYPLERALFDSTSLSASYVGHPLVSVTTETTPCEKVITVFPGSRRFLVAKCIDAFLDVCGKLQEERPDLVVNVSCATFELERVISRALRRKRTMRAEIIPTHEIAAKNALLHSTRAAFAVPGTINLELASRNIPSLIACPTSPLIRFLFARYASSERARYTLVNYLNHEQIFPELVLEPFSVSSAVAIMQTLLWDDDVRHHMQSQCASFAATLENKRHHEDVANIVLSLL